MILSESILLQTAGSAIAGAVGGLIAGLLLARAGERAKATSGERDRKQIYDWLCKRYNGYTQHSIAAICRHCNVSLDAARQACYSHTDIVPVCPSRATADKNRDLPDIWKEMWALREDMENTD